MSDDDRPSGIALFVTGLLIGILLAMIAFTAWGPSNMKTCQWVLAHHAHSAADTVAIMRSDAPFASGCFLR